MIKNSFGSETMELYKNIDLKVDTHFSNKRRQAPCSKGCASCCSQFFEISEVEYVIILNHLKDWEEAKINKLIDTVDLYNKLLKKYHNKFYNEFFSVDMKQEFSCNKYYNNPERFRIQMPCVFLSREGACSIYSFRPLVCRTTGVGYKHNFEVGSVCSEIPSINKARSWQADLREFRDEILSVNWLTPEKPQNISNYDQENNSIELRQYPIFYFVYESFIKSKVGFSDPRLKEYFDLSKEEFVKQLNPPK